MSDSSDTSAKESSPDKTTSSPSRISDVITTTQETDCFDSTSKTTPPTLSSTASYIRLTTSSQSPAQSGDETAADSTTVEAITELTTDGASDLQSDIISLPRNDELRTFKTWKIGSSSSTAETSGSISINIPGDSSRSSNVDVRDGSDADLATEMRSELGKMAKIRQSTELDEMPSTSGMQPRPRPLKCLSHLAEEDFVGIKSSPATPNEDLSFDSRLVRGKSHNLSVPHIDDKSRLSSIASSKIAHFDARGYVEFKQENVQDAYAKGYLRNWDKGGSDKTKIQSDTLSNNGDEVTIDPCKNISTDDEITKSIQWQMYRHITELPQIFAKREIIQQRTTKASTSQAETSQAGSSKPPPKKHYKGAKRSIIQRRQSSPTEQIIQECQTTEEEITLEEEQICPQTVHGISSAGRKPAIWNIFRQKDKSPSVSSQEPTKRSFMSQIKRTLLRKQNIETEAKEASKVEKIDASAHLKAGSKKRYYHTLSAVQSRRPSNISRLMDLFQRRPSALNETAETEKRRKKSQIQHEQLLAARERLRKALQDDVNKASKALMKQEKPDSTLTYQPIDQLLMSFYEKQPSADSNRNLHVSSFFEQQTCYEVMLPSVKIVVFDSKSTLSSLFKALVYHDLRSAPIWNSELNQYTGVVTVTDYIKVLYNYYETSNPLIETMGQQKVAEWKYVQGDMVAPFTTIGPEDNLKKGAEAILTYGVHRVPIIDPKTGNFLGFLTSRHILRYFYHLMRDYSVPSYMNDKLKYLKVATLDNIDTIDRNTTILTIFKKFIDLRVSSLPVLDSEGRLIDIFSKSDVFALCKDMSLHDLNIPLNMVTVGENRWYKGLRTCTLEDTFFRVMMRMVKENIRRLIIVDTKSKDKVIGMISISDIIKRLITDEQDDSISTPSRPASSQVKRNYSSATTLSPESSLGSFNEPSTQS